MRFRGSEGTPLAGSAVLDFWRWAHSSVLNNTTRGRLAEFIVSRAIGARGDVANEWGAYDLDTAAGVKVEVKSAAYVQDWKQKARSRILFAIRPTLAWDRETGRFEGPLERHANVYVFCLLGDPDRVTVDPLDLSRWQFYVVPRATLDTEFPTGKTLSLARLQRLAQAIDVRSLAEAVSAAALIS